MTATIARRLLKKKDVTTFPDEEISFFRIKGISIILIMAYQNLVSNAIRKVLLKVKHINKGLGSIRGVFGPMSKISFTLSNYSFVIWDKNYRRYFVI